MECNDFLEFQDSLNKMRSLDDKLVYTLNTSIPTESFKNDATTKCKDLFSSITKGHAQREVSIKKCILMSAEKVKKLKEKRENNRDDMEIAKYLKAEQTKMRMLQSELSVEEVIKERTLKLFNERCRNYYKPNLQSS